MCLLTRIEPVSPFFHQGNHSYNQSMPLPIWPQETVMIRQGSIKKQKQVCQKNMKALT